MFAFERFNKRIKDLCRNRHLVHESLSESCRLDMATRFMTFSINDYEDDVPDCVLRGHQQYYCLTEDETDELHDLGVIDHNWSTSCNIAVILGIHFRANEWGKKRCGSVVVTTFNGKSRYCIVRKFINIQNQVFASVQWFCTPVYEYFPNTLVVRVTIAGDDEQSRLGCMLSVKKIIPTRVYVLPDNDGIHYNLIRKRGTDLV